MATREWVPPPTRRQLAQHRNQHQCALVDYTAVNRLHCALDGVDLLGLFVSIRLTLHPY